MERISEGAEAVLFAVDVAGVPAVVKDRIEKAYRVRALDDEIRSQRTKSEARILARASSSGIKVPKVLMVSKHKIFMERLYGETLNAIMQEKMVGKKELEGIFSEAGKRLAELHALGISHGDYTPANILVSNREVFVIDFGLAEMTKSDEEKALDLLLMKRSVSKKFYALFLSSYTAAFSDAERVTERLGEIEKRGRYQTRTMITG